MNGHLIHWITDLLDHWLYWIIVLLDWMVGSFACQIIGPLDHYIGWVVVRLEQIIMRSVNGTCAHIHHTFKKGSKNKDSNAVVICFSKLINYSSKTYSY